MPPQYAASQVAGDVKVKSAIHLAPAYKYAERHFWVRGFFVSMVGRDEHSYPRLHQKSGERI